MDKQTFEIFGCCVSRDSFAYNLEESDFNNKSYIVTRFINFISTYTLLSGTKVDIALEKLLRAVPDLNRFKSKMLVIDAAKNGIDYLFSDVDKADWFVLDVGNERWRTLEWKNSNVILTYGEAAKKCCNIISDVLGDSNVNLIEPWEHCSEKVLERFEEIMDLFLKYYQPCNMILFKFYAAYDYVSLTGARKKFAREEVERSKKWNHIFECMNQVAEVKLKGCHIINAPENIIADASNRWGLAPLHYHKLYYEYAEKAISVITQEKLDREREEEKLENLRLLYSEKFAALCEKAEATSVRLDREKWRNYSNTFKSLALKNLLLPDKSAALSLQNAFLSKGYTHIAIYGDTEITKVLAHILRGTSVTIDYIVENAAKPFPGIKTVNRNPADYPNCDLMLVADVFAWQDIKKKLEKLRLPFPFVNAAEFIQSLPAGQGIGELQAYVNSLKEKQADLEENVAQLQKSAEAYAAEKAQMQAAFGELSDRYQASEQKAADLATEVDGLQVKNKAAQRDIEELSVENKAAKEEIEGLHRKQTEAQKQIVAITSQRDAAVADAASLRNSVSYKFGRAMTFLPRKIRDVFKKK